MVRTMVRPLIMIGHTEALRTFGLSLSTMKKLMTRQMTNRLVVIFINMSDAPIEDVAAELGGNFVTFCPIGFDARRVVGCGAAGDVASRGFHDALGHLPAFRV